MYTLNNNVIYFDSFGVEHIPKEIKRFMNKLTIVTNIFRIQAYASIGFIDFMLAGKTLTDFTSLFSPSNFKKNNNIILNYFMTNVSKWLSAIPMKQLIHIQI